MLEAYTNLRLYTSNDEEWAEFRRMMHFLETCKISYALTYSTIIYHRWVSEFWKNATIVRAEPPIIIHSRVQGETIIIIEESISEMFNFYDVGAARWISVNRVRVTMDAMGYQGTYSNGAVPKHNFPPVRQYMMSQICVCFSKKQCG
jgi:hypothetical protein